jgi:hypothetical protein
MLQRLLSSEKEEHHKLNARVQRLAGLRVSRTNTNTATDFQPISTRQPTFTDVRNRLEKRDRERAAQPAAKLDDLKALIKEREEKIGLASPSLANKRSE